MDTNQYERSTEWRHWRIFFENRPRHALPDPFSVEPALAAVPPSVARSLAIFQLGESGGGHVIEQARRSRLPGLDEDYAAAVARFVAEEHRHAELLACGVRMLGGRLIRRNWTAKLFVLARRLLGLRLKITVLFAAEVVGICYYALLASRLPQSRLRSLLETIVNDEVNHLDFHCHFLRTQTRGAWRKRIFLIAWRPLMAIAGLAVLIDHRRALRDLGISSAEVRKRWVACSRQAEELVTGDACTGSCRGPAPASAD